MRQQRHHCAGIAPVGLLAAALVAGPAAAQLSQWTDVSTPELAGVGHEGHRGAAWGDYNDDGLVDLYVTHWGPSTAPDPLLGSPNQLFVNMGGGILLETTTTPIDVPGIPWGLSHHPAWGDIDNDGLLDLYVTQSSNFCQDQSHLYRQTAPGVFADVTNDEPLSHWCTLPRSVSWVDFDRDGLLDIYTSNSGGDGVSNRMMINQGDGTFQRAVGVLEIAGRESRGAAWCDFNNDGLQDLYVGNGAESIAPEWYRTNVLFLNVGGGEFIDIAEYAGVANLGHARGVMWGDVNNDGWFDLILGNNPGQDVSGQNRLYINNGDLTFTDVSVASGIFENKRTRDVSFADFDNDGLLDMYAVNFGSLLPPNRLWHNNGNLTFTDVAPGTPLTGEPNGDVGAWCDFDGDGWLDLYVVGGSHDAPGVGQNRLCRNDNQNGNHWIELDLVGVVSNRLAIGARVTVTAGGVSRTREVQSGTGYNAQHMHRVHVGLGSATVIDTIEIRWPSGIELTRSGDAVDQILVIQEDPEGPIVDCNENGTADVLDISTGTSNDCDHDGIPDECDGPCDDCNGNGELDLLDFLAGVLIDCDDNGEYDVCEIAGDPDLDCNDNGLIDTCELAADCDGDGLPDECRIADEPGLDTNGNGILDFCEAIGDLDGSGLVDIADLILVIVSWGPCPVSGQPCFGDADGNGIVDVSDLVLVIVHWGESPVE